MGLLDKITLKDLDPEQRKIAEKIGINAYLNLIAICGGTYLYIPKFDSIERNLRNEQIKKEFTGYNFKQLARKYNLTEVTIRNLVGELDKEMKAAPIDGQITLFQV